MQQCPHHQERAANLVCAVCGRYFCEECVAERYYPRHEYICHHCSGEKPYEPPPQPVKPAPEVVEVEERRSLGEWVQRWWVPGIEWVALAGCLAFIGYRIAISYGSQIEQLVLVSNAPEDIAVYCLGSLDNFAYQGKQLTVDDVRAACPPPLEMTQEDAVVVVVSPDPERYGFTEVEVELSPATLAVLE